MRASARLATLLLSSFGACAAIADETKLSAFERQLKSLEAPLTAELVERGLADADAESAAKKAVEELIRCSKTSDEYSQNDSITIVIRMGGKTLATQATSCIYEFLGSVGIAVQ